MKKRSLYLFFTLFTLALSSTQAETNSFVVEISPDYIPQKRMEQTELNFNATVASYLQSLVNKKFPKSKTRLRVQNGQVIMANLPHDTQEKQALIAYVENTVTKPSDKEFVEKTGMWFPESTTIYPTALANPLQVVFSGGIRLRDSVAGQVATPVTFGVQFPLYRWNNVELFSTPGDLQLEVEGAVFSIFNQTEYSSPLINADYYVGVPISFQTGPWAHRLRIYHISSHLGDEYMDRKHHAQRKNKSFEAIDIATSYFITDQIRVYGAFGVIPHSDSEMHLKPLYVQYGLEVKAGRREFEDLYGTPFMAMHFENWQDCDYKIDANFALGYEWGKLNGLGRKFRVSLEYHNGQCLAGQFSRKHSDYIQARISYGF